MKIFPFQWMLWILAMAELISTRYCATTVGERKKVTAVTFFRSPTVVTSPQITKGWTSISKLRKCALGCLLNIKHYSDVIMSPMASQITGVSIFCSIFCSGADQSSALLAFVSGIHQWHVDLPPPQRASNAENVLIWLCHLVCHRENCYCHNGLHNNHWQGTISGFIPLIGIYILYIYIYTYIYHNAMKKSLDFMIISN